jgi:hypothetical protein
MSIVTCSIRFLIDIVKGLYQLFPKVLVVYRLGLF